MGNFIEIESTYWRRMDMGLSQVELARKIGCSARHYGSIEAGKANPTRRMLLKIARALRMRPESLYHTPVRDTPRMKG